MFALIAETIKYFAIFARRREISTKMMEVEGYSSLVE